MMIAHSAPLSAHGNEGLHIRSLLYRVIIVLMMALAALSLVLRLGMARDTAFDFALFFLVFFIIWVSALGRTMSGTLFFNSAHMARPAHIGLSGINDYISTCFIFVILSLQGFQQSFLVLALFLGLFWKTCLFARAISHANVSTLAGFFAWRSTKQRSGFIALIIITAILTFFIIGELKAALYIITQVFPLPPTLACCLILSLAVLPTLFGGWTSLLLVNATLVLMFIIIAFIAALSTTFLPSLVESGYVFQGILKPLPPLDLAITHTGLTNDSSLVSVILSFFIFSAGFAVLPHALSRITLAATPIKTIQSLGWLAGYGSIVISVFIFSFGLFTVENTLHQGAMVLYNHPLIHFILYFALVCAAINSLSAMLFVLASSYVRAARRGRKLNPDEQSVFATRLLVLFFAALLVLSTLQITVNDVPSVQECFLYALTIGAGCLFFPLIAAAWGHSIPSIGIDLAMVAGALAFITGQEYFFTAHNSALIYSATSAMGASAFILLSSWLYAQFLQRQKN